MKILTAFNQGLNAWRARDSTSATTHFRSALHLRGDRGDVPTQIYLQRLKNQPVLPGSPLAL